MIEFFPTGQYFGKVDKTFLEVGKKQMRKAPFKQMCKQFEVKNEGQCSFNRSACYFTSFLVTVFRPKPTLQQCSAFLFGVEAYSKWDQLYQAKWDDEMLQIQSHQPS